MVEGGFGVVLGTAPETTARCCGRVLGPEFETAFDSQGGDKVGINSGRQPLEL